MTASVDGRSQQVARAASAQQVFFTLARGFPYQAPRLVWTASVSSSTGFVPIFHGADNGHPLPRRPRQADAGRMSRIAVVTSSPPMVEGGHMVIARSLVQALREAGHDADIVVTPQNRFGRQASAYLATWLTDVGIDRRAADRSGDQPALSELRGAASRATCAG